MACRESLEAPFCFARVLGVTPDPNSPRVVERPGPWGATAPKSSSKTTTCRRTPSRARSMTPSRSSRRATHLSRATFARNLGGRGRHAVEGVGGAGGGLEGVRRELPRPLPGRAAASRPPRAVHLHACVWGVGRSAWGVLLGAPKFSGRGGAGGTGRGCPQRPTQLTHALELPLARRGRRTRSSSCSCSARASLASPPSSSR